MKTRNILAIATALIISLPALAEKQIVDFGGSFGLNYAPDSFNIEVGDTIVWQGDFTQHPLERVTKPTGAADFGSGTGSTFSYVVTVAGDYTYHCTIHGGSGMTGKFTATNPSTGIGETGAATDVKVFPVVTTDFVTVNLANQNGNKFSAELINAEGRMINQTPVLNNSARIDFTVLNNGVYFIRVKDENSIVSITKILKQ